LDYKTGSHRITARKSHICEKCHKSIRPTTQYFARVKVIDDTHKTYKRYHFSCARTLTNLNEYELSLFPDVSETLQAISIAKHIRAKEEKEIYTDAQVVGKYPEKLENQKTKALSHLIAIAERDIGVEHEAR